MTTETASPVEGMSSVDLPADAPESFSSVNEAAAYFSELQEKRKNTPAESADTATAEPELAQANADPETAPSEEPEAIDPAEELPPIEPPRSWTKEEKEAFTKLPRDMQEINSRIASAREAEFRRSQNELVEMRKSAEAAEAKARQVESEFAAKLQSPVTPVAVIEEKMRSEFPEVKNGTDLEKLQQEDPFRFQRWQALQALWYGAKSETDQFEARKTQEKQSNRAKYEVEQTSILKELVPEFADDKKFAAAKERVINMLTGDLGLKNDQLSRWYSDDTGHEILSSAGIQKLMVDGLKYRELQAAPKAVASKPLPPVQKPGTSKPAGSDVSERIQALSRKQELSVNEATELYMLQQRPRRAS